MERQMKAAVYEAFGGVEQIKISHLKVPEVKEGELLIRIQAAAVNPVDAGVLHGNLKDFLPTTFPVVPGWDIAGVVEESGYSARRFQVGDAVYAYARRPIVQWGTFAEYLVIPESYVALRPHNLPAEEAAGIPLVGLTAYQSLYEAGQLSEGQTVLILGASGGIGSLAIQLAKAKGARVIGVASTGSLSFMKELGADETIDYKNSHVGEDAKALAPEGVDLIFDAASGETLQQSLSALKKEGKLVSILNRGQNLPAGIHFQYVFVEPNALQLDHLRQIAEAGKIKVPISKRYNLEQTAEALQQIQTHHTRGKIVIVP